MNSISIDAPKHPLSFSYSLSGSKSFSNRAVLLAAISPGVVSIRNFSPSDDSELLLRALAQVGISFEIDGTTVRKKANHSKPIAGTYSIDVGPAGTTSRFLTAFFACSPGLMVTLSGSERLHQRPIGPLVNALRSLGASIEYLGIEGCLPLRVNGRQLAGGVVEIDGSISSQFLTSLLLVAGLLTSSLRACIKGGLVSRSYLDMTFETLKRFGYQGQFSGDNCFVNQGHVSDSVIDYVVEGDATGATYLFNLAMLSGGIVRVHNLSRQSIQGDLGYLDALVKMGGEVSQGSSEDIGWIEVHGPKKLIAIECDMEQMPDAAQSLAVLAACAEGTSRLTGLSTLRVKETDRISAVCEQLQRLGIRAHDNGGADELVIEGGIPVGARIRTYDDHRMAMAFAGIALRCDGLCIEEPDVVKKSFPQYWDMLLEAGFRIIENGG
jgi:3-phosphoshikimate 1-carboxyvinyltransferase